MGDFGKVIEGLQVWNYHVDSVLSELSLAGIYEAVSFPSPLLNVPGVGTPANSNICGAFSESQRLYGNIAIGGEDSWTRNKWRI